MLIHSTSCYCRNPCTPHHHIATYPTRTEFYKTPQWYQLMTILYKLGFTVFY